MARAVIVSSGELWQEIRSEAQRAVAADRVFGTTLSTSILVHENFAAALSDLIGRRLKDARILHAQRIGTSS